MSAPSLEEQVRMILAIGRRQPDEAALPAHLQLQTEGENAIYSLLVQEGIVQTRGCQFRPNGASYDLMKCQLTVKGRQIYQAAEDNFQSGVQLLEQKE